MISSRVNAFARLSATERPVGQWLAGLLDHCNGTGWNVQIAGWAVQLTLQNVVKPSFQIIFGHAAEDHLVCHVAFLAFLAAATLASSLAMTTSAGTPSSAATVLLMAAMPRRMNSA